MKRRSRLLIGLLILSSAIGVTGYRAYSTLYDYIMDRAEAVQLRIEEVSGTHPLQLRVTVGPNQGYLIIRNVTTTTRGANLTIFYHLALVGLAKPVQVWGKPYTLTVPDSVTEVAFGKASDTVWKRGGNGR